MSPKREKKYGFTIEFFSQKLKKLPGFAKFTIENPAIFCHFWGKKCTSKSINFSFFGLIFLLQKGVLFAVLVPFRRLNALSRIFILWLGVASNFPVFVCEFRPAKCISRRENAFHSEPNP